MRDTVAVFAEQLAAHIEAQPMMMALADWRWLVEGIRAAAAKASEEQECPACHVPLAELPPGHKILSRFLCSENLLELSREERLVAAINATLEWIGDAVSIHKQNPTSYNHIRRLLEAALHAEPKRKGTS